MRTVWLLLLPLAAQAGLAEDMAALRERPLEAVKLASKQCDNAISRDTEATREAVRLGLPLAANAPRERSMLLVCRGYLAETAGQLKAALADYSAAEKAAIEARDDERRSQALALRGEIRQRLGAYDAALADLQQAHRLAPAGGEHQSYALNAIANFYSDPLVGQYAQALDYYDQLLALHRAAGRADEIATALFNQASTLQRLARYADAEPLFRQALVAYETLKDRTSVGETLRALAGLLLRQSRPAEALSLTERALAVAQELKDPELRMSTLATRGSALRRLGRWREAEADLQAAYAYYAEQGAVRFQTHAAGELAEVAAAQHQWHRAYTLRSEQFRLEEQLRLRQQQELSSRLRIQFDVERMEQQTAAARRESTLQEAALHDATRIRQLQWALMAAGGLIAAFLAVWGWRAVGRARRFVTLAYSDALTGVPNRRSILEHLDAALHGEPAAQVLMVDVDHFKRINDTHGHEAGDTVLRAVAQALQDSLGTDGRLGRLGGEEFLVLAPGADLAMLGERLRLAVAALRFTGVLSDLKVQVSAGGARALPGDTRSEQLLQRADAALYRAKAEGRDRVVISDEA